MTTTNFAQTILEVKKGSISSLAVDEATAYSAAQLISGSFTLSLYQVHFSCFQQMTSAY